MWSAVVSFRFESEKVECWAEVLESGCSAKMLAPKITTFPAKLTYFTYGLLAKLEIADLIPQVNVLNSIYEKK